MPLFRNSLVDRAELVAENLAFRQQLAILEHKSKRRRLRKRDLLVLAALLVFLATATWTRVVSFESAPRTDEGFGLAGNGVLEGVAQRPGVRTKQFPIAKTALSLHVT